MLPHGDHRSVSLDPITGDNLVNAGEAAALTISGHSHGYDLGEIVTINIFDRWHHLVRTATAAIDEDGNWASSIIDPPLADGRYSIAASIGAGRHASSDHEAFGVDTTPPNVAVNPVTFDDIVNPFENSHGFKVTGTATGADGQKILIEIVDHDTDTVIGTETAFVHHGHWKVEFEDLPFSFGDQYAVRTKVTDAAGNEGAAEHAFTTYCFYPGTLIRTPAGEVAVETLRRGDLVLTNEGCAVPVTWLGRQTISTRFADPLRVLPIRVRAGALGDNMPARDLLVSPDHALFVGGVLVQAGALVNGLSITRETNVPQTFTYYHVEVDDHALILAENVPAETFIDNVDRLGFDNWDEHEALYPQGKAMAEMPYPRAKAHRQVPRMLREMLAARSATLYPAELALSHCG